MSCSCLLVSGLTRNAPVLLPVGFSISCCAVSTGEPTCAAGAASEYVPDDPNLVAWAAVVIKHASVAFIDDVLWICGDFGLFWKVSKSYVALWFARDAALTAGASTVVMTINFAMQHNQVVTI